ncbi:MAG: lamin tail domain-containing protein, partial [Akkermansiaceae bacterium]|nr:lamin tail domain-containing protein [Akkermansiaceae bacterium]
LGGVTLRATLMVDDGAVIYLNGQEAARVHMDPGPVGYGTFANTTINEAAEETITISSAHLVAGDNVIAVEVHQVNGTSTDVVMGMKLDAEVFVGAVAAVVVNEVLVDNRTGVNPDGSTAGWVELYNPSGSDSDLTGMTLSDDFGAPRKWEFPAGTMLPAGTHLVIQCNPLAPASATNTGFGLDPDGGRVLLFDAPPIGGGLRDAVAFGHQLADRSVGRSPDGSGAFTLNLPTRGAINQPAALAPTTALRLNEWLASSSRGDDWFEIYNTADHPVQLGGHYLTDDLRDKMRHAVLPLTFIGAGADDRWLVFTADGNGSQPGHVNFALKTSGEELGIFTATGVTVAAIAFGAQVADVSEGGFPDGSATMIKMPPTPGAAPASTRMVTASRTSPSSSLARSRGILAAASRRPSRGTMPVVHWCGSKLSPDAVTRSFGRTPWMASGPNSPMWLPNRRMLSLKWLTSTRPSCRGVSTAW